MPIPAPATPHLHHSLLEPYLALLPVSVEHLIDRLPSCDELNLWFEAARVSRFPAEPELIFRPAIPKTHRRRRPAGPVDIHAFYDAQITLERHVPTRERELHDFCNFLAWLAFPRSKRAIHARQLAAIRRWIPQGADRIPGARLREQDALTLFDEGGALLLDGTVGVASSARPHAIAFGHALLEHFALRELPIAATAMRIGMPRASFPDALDLALSERIADPSRFTAPGLDALVMLERVGVVGVVGSNAS